MKLLCLVALSVCVIVQGANLQNENILPPGISISKALERSQYDLNILAPNYDEIHDIVLSQSETSAVKDERLISGAIEEILEELRDVIINGSDDVPVLDPLVAPFLGPFEYRTTGILLGLPRFCSASGMFAEARVDGFHTIMRKRCASLVRRIRASSNGLLDTIAKRLDCVYMNRCCAVSHGVTVESVVAEASINNLRMEGLRWFVADRINVNPVRLTFGITLTVPWLTVTGSYDARARVALISHRAGGNFRVFAHRIEVGFDMRMGTNIFGGGHLVLRELDIHIDIHDTQISITGMTGSTLINTFISSTIQSVTQELIQTEMQNVSSLLSEELFEVINEVLKEYTVSDIFG